MGSGKRSGWKWLRRNHQHQIGPGSRGPRIGLALGGGFARAVAHVGVLRVLEREKIPLHCITGVSAGSIVAAAYASGATAGEIGAVASAMRFGDVARWCISRLGLAASDRMKSFLQRLLKCSQFEQMLLPLGVIATDLRSGKPVAFRDHGDVAAAIRASCSYPGLFCPVEIGGRVYVDGAMSVEVPSRLARRMGATHVISACIPNQDETLAPRNLGQIVSRCFQIMMANNEQSWRNHSDIVLAPDVGNIPWDGFDNAQRMIEAGEHATEAALPQIREWLGKRRPVAFSFRSGAAQTTSEQTA